VVSKVCQCVDVCQGGGDLKEKSCERKMFYAFKKGVSSYRKDDGVLWLTKCSKRSRTLKNTKNLL
jgi:hypothetical protein